VTYSKTETHHVHLPVNLAGSVSFCLGSAVEVANNLRSLGASVCNTTIVAEAMDLLRTDLTAQAAGQGFIFSLSYWTSGLQNCVVDFSIEVTQPNVVGPLGPFNWVLEVSQSFQRQ